MLLRSFSRISPGISGSMPGPLTMSLGVFPAITASRNFFLNSPLKRTMPGETSEIYERRKESISQRTGQYKAEDKQNGAPVDGHEPSERTL